MLQHRNEAGRVGALVVIEHDLTVDDYPVGPDCIPGLHRQNPRLFFEGNEFRSELALDQGDLVGGAANSERLCGTTIDVVDEWEVKAVFAADTHARFRAELVENAQYSCAGSRQVGHRAHQVAQVRLAARAPRPAVERQQYRPLTKQTRKTGVDQQSGLRTRTPE